MSRRIEYRVKGLDCSEEVAISGGPKKIGQCVKVDSRNLLRRTTSQ